jgi:hypothetical protein
LLLGHVLVRSLEGYHPICSLLCLLEEVIKFVSEIFVVEFNHNALLGELRLGGYGRLRHIREIIGDMR